jgi:O-antigen/teichoic acid export membrane protein
MGAASGIVAIAVLAMERIGWPNGVNDPMLRLAARGHWRYGRWAVGAALLGLLPTQICYLALTGLADAGATGALRAVSNLILPLIQINIALGALLLPALSSSVSSDDSPRERRLLFGGSMALIAFPAVVGAVLALFTEPLLRFCYGERYNGYGWLVRAIALVPVLLGATMLVNSWLAARRRQDAVFYSSLSSAIAAATLGVGLTWHDQLRGAALGVLVSIAVALVVSLVFARGEQENTALARASAGGRAA